MTAKRLLLIAPVLALLVASGVVWAAATATTHAVVQLLFGYSDPGTTWTEGGMTHMRGAGADTLLLWDYDGDGNADEVTIAVLTINTDRDANGAGNGHGTWSEYDSTGTMLLGGGTWHAKYTCSEFLVGEEYAYGWVNPVGWRLGPNGDWGHVRMMLTLYANREDYPTPFVNEGEASFLVPGGP